MTASSKRTLSILLALSLFTAAIFIYVFLIKPVYSDVVNLRTKVSNLSQTLNNYTLLNNDFQTLFSEYQNLGDLENQLSMVLPKKLSADYAIAQITGLAKSSGLDVKTLSLKEMTIKPSSVGLAKGVGTLRIDSRMAGSYDAFKSFIKKLESNIMISDISNFGIILGAGELTFNLSIDTYYQTE
ncbi:hypothetical protein HZC33_02355 [Candidatus Wolfebacteria bacterium]|nr:hypothetical protein [Candidatus Wolfebacteria bacterium]